MNSNHLPALAFTKNGATLTSTSIIADGVENTHESVIKLVRKYLDDLREFGWVGFEIEPFETNGGKQEREIALLNEHQSTLLLTYMRNTEIVRLFKKRLVRAFFEMAKNQQMPTPAAMSRLELIQLAMQTEQERLALESQIAELKPSVAALERLTKADGSMCITDAAKQLQTTPKKLFALLSVEGWIYRRQGTGWIAYQEKIQAGLLEHKLSVIERTDGTEKTVSQVRITPKGMAKAGKLLESLAVAA